MPYLLLLLTPVVFTTGGGVAIVPFPAALMSAGNGVPFDSACTRALDALSSISRMAEMRFVMSRKSFTSSERRSDGMLETILDMYSSRIARLSATTSLFRARNRSFFGSLGILASRRGNFLLRDWSSASNSL